jgi:hypothetical protein
VNQFVEQNGSSLVVARQVEETADPKHANLTIAVREHVQIPWYHCSLRACFGTH